MRPSDSKWKRRSSFKERPQLSMLALSQSPSSWTNLQRCPPFTKKPWLLPLPMLIRLAGLLRGQIGLTQQDLARVSDDLTTSLAQARPRRSVEGEHSGEALNFGPFQPAGDEPC